MTILDIRHQRSAIVASHTGRFAAMMLWVLCSIVAMPLCAPLAAQQSHADSPRPSSLVTGLELSALGGSLGASNDVVSVPSNSPFFRSIRGGLYTMWTSKPWLADASFSLASTSAFGMRTTLPLSNLHIATRRGRVSFSLGVEQTMGVATRGSARGTQDTAGTTPSDTGLTFPAPGSTATQSTFSPSALMRASDIVGGLGWHTTVSTMQLLAGLRANDLRRGAWAGVRGSVAIDERNALMFSMQRQPSHTSIRTPSFTVGFRTFAWRWGNSAPLIVTEPPRTTSTDARLSTPVRIEITGDTLRLHIHLPAAHHAAVMGDATAWQSAELTRDETGWWNIALRATDAMSRIQLRSDDDTWRPIPGLPTTRDEYGGTISLLAPPSTVTTPTP